MRVDTQNEVVKEEKRLRYDNSPYGQILFAIQENLFKKHPYKNKHIGEMDHLDAATLEEFQAYFDKWYVPNNAVLVVAGDFDTYKTKKLVKDYFSEIQEKRQAGQKFSKRRANYRNNYAKFYDPNIQIPAIYG